MMAQQSGTPAWRNPASETANAPEHVEPFRHRLLVVPEKTPDKIGMIHVPDSAKQRQQKGVVVRVGPGKHLDNGTVRPIGINVGDFVLFNHYAGKYAGTTVKLDDGREALLIEEDDVVGVYR